MISPEFARQYIETCKREDREKTYNEIYQHMLANDNIGTIFKKLNKAVSVAIKDYSYSTDITEIFTNSKTENEKDIFEVTSMLRSIGYKFDSVNGKLILDWKGF